jgi:hypothetical protein
MSLPFSRDAAYLRRMLSRLAPVLIVALALTRGALLPPPPFVDWTHDECYFVPLALARGAPQDAPLFARDALFQEFAPAFPAAYIAIVEVATRGLGSIEAALRWIPATLLVIFVLGVYALTRRLTASALAGLAAATLAAHPWPTPFFVGFGIVPQRLFPRDVTTALLPWLLLLAFNGSRRLPFFLAGLLATIHPVSAPQVWVLLAAVTLVIARNNGSAEKTPRVLITGALLFVLGALPYLATFARLPDVSPPPIDLVRYRMPYVLPPSLSGITRFLLQALPLAVAGGAALVTRALAGRERRLLIALLVGAAAMAVLTPLTVVVPRLLPLQPIRAAQYVYLPLLVGAGALIARVQRRGAAGTALAALIWLVLVNQARPIEEPLRVAERLGASPQAMATAASIARSANAVRPIDALGRAAAGLGFAERPQNFLLQTEPGAMREVMAASHVDTQGDRASFLELARFAHDRSARTDLFLIPPVGLDHFRAYARRGVYGCWKDGGVILFSSHYATAWKARFDELVRIYSRHDAAAFARLLDSGAVQFVVCDARRPRLDLPVAFENTRFVVYRSSRSASDTREADGDGGRAGA